MYIIVIALLVAYACALPGLFLVLRGTALMSDAISHAVLPGIVGMFLITHSLHSPLLIVAAAAGGMLTVCLTNYLISQRSLKEDAAIGLVFPLFFSIGIMMLCVFARTIHLDIDMVIMGEIIFAPFNTWHIAGYNMGPCALWNMSIILLINALCISSYYKELQLCLFDPIYAQVLQFSPTCIDYMLLSLTGITCVGAFDIVGSVVVVALIVGPAATAYVLTKQLHHMLYIAYGFATASVLLGYLSAYYTDTSVTGSIAAMNGLLFACAVAYARIKELITDYVSSKKAKSSCQPPNLYGTFKNK
jgi:manganese/zinc/iron transport system permease protein